MSGSSALDAVVARLENVAARLEAAEAERVVVEAIAQCKKPDMGGLQKLVEPVGIEISAADKLTQGRRSAAFNYSKAVAEALPALSWVVYSGPSCGMDPPPKHVENHLQSAEFWTNKILLENRTAPHADWVKALKDLLKGLCTYLKTYHFSGPAWNPNGIPLSQFKPGSAPASGAPAPQAAGSKVVPPKRGPPAPPPPMPAGGPGSLIKDAPKKAAAPAAAGMNALFSELNKGDGVTKGLRKVTDDMKSKNRADRTGVVPSAADAPSTSGSKSAPAAPAASKPARTECEQGRKWVIENHVDNPEIIISDTNPRQAVYIYKCSNSTIQVKGKVNAISVDSCQRVGLLFEDLVAACELVNSARIQVQVTGVVPTIAVDKCDGVQLYLSADSLGVDLTTAKSSEVNVMVPGATAEADLVEHAIPEQYISQYKNGKFVTAPVSHSAG
ncbi:g193 [Coccomyxa elongata]